MIGYLRGEVLDLADGKAIVNVQGVGYQVSLPQSPAYLGFRAGIAVELFVHTHVREDMLDLYGFSSKTEKELFLTLLSVNGIGPKGALGILSKVSSAELIGAVLAGDVEQLTKIPGIGKKIAERVVLELGAPFRKKMEAGAFGSAALISKKTSLQPLIDGVDLAEVALLRDAKAALLGLGYREQEMSGLLHKILSETEKPPTQVEELVRLALRQLA